MAAKRKSARRPEPKLGDKADFIRRHPHLSASELVREAAKQGLIIRTPQVYKIRTAGAKSNKRSRKPAAPTTKPAAPARKRRAKARKPARKAAPPPAPTKKKAASPKKRAALAKKPVAAPKKKPAPARKSVAAPKKKPAPPKRRPAKASKPASVAMPAPPASGTMSKSEFIRTRPDGMTAKEVVAAAAAQGMILSEHFVYNIRSSAKKKAGGAGPTVGASAPAAVVGRSGSRDTVFRKLALDLGIERAKQLLSEVEAKLAALIAGR